MDNIKVHTKTVVLRVELVTGGKIINTSLIVRCVETLRLRRRVETVDCK